MSKVSIDTDVISNILLPLSRSEVDRILNAISSANQVHFPNGEYNWSGIVGDLNDCKEEGNKYVGWISDMNDKYVNHMVNRVDDINSIAIDEPKKHTSIVK